MGEVSSKTIRAADVKYQLQLCALYHYPHKHTHTLTNKLVEVLLFLLSFGIGRGRMHTHTQSYSATRPYATHSDIWRTINAFGICIVPELFIVDNANIPFDHAIPCFNKQVYFEVCHWRVRKYANFLPIMTTELERRAKLSVFHERL